MNKKNLINSLLSKDVKCEFLNPGGSVKDRIGYRMVQDAREKGLLKPGYTVIEPTSGNTGIGLAMACAVYGYKCLIVMPEKMSDEKVGALHCLGAEIIRTPNEAGFESPEGLISVAQQLKKKIPNSIILDQYRNSGNPLAHYDGTGAEILHQMDNKVDMIVLGAGTGGTVTGIGRRIKDDCPDCIVVSADPHGSILARPEELNKTDVTFYEVEGIGYDFIPTVLDHQVVDKWYKVIDSDAIPMARRLIREEGILCGGSSGAAMAVAIKAAKNLKAGQSCVIILPDSIRNYMSKWVNDSWMEARGLKESVNKNKYTWWETEISELKLDEPLTISPNITFQEATKFLKVNNLEQVPIVDTHGILIGMAAQTQMLNKMLAFNLKPTDTIEKFVYKAFRKVSSTTGIGKVSRILEKEPFVVITSVSTNGEERALGVVKKIDILNYITNN